ncbi:4Fe-4S binding protein [bacterium]|nr:4Fe-4S binding protein [bacterium]
MKTWFKMLSKRQKQWLYGTLATMAVIILIGIIIQPEREEVSTKSFYLDNSIADIAPTLGVTGKAFAKELKLDIEISKKLPLRELEITEEELQHAVEHLLSHEDTMIKYYIFSVLVLGALIYLVRLGRPDNSDIRQKKHWYPNLVYLMTLIITVTFCGFAFGKSPNPMESAVKIFKTIVGLYPDPFFKTIAFLFFLLLAVVGNKIICGWACPFGALQELIYFIPVLKKLKKKKIPFWITNTIRGIIFIIMLLILFGLIGSRRGLVIYHYINPFNLFNFDLEENTILIAVVIFLIVSFGFYRSFCQFICPFGFISWIFERLSIFSVKIDHDLCTKCGACIRACPLDSAKAKVEKKKIQADCFSCTRCLNVCPTDAIKYTNAGKHTWKISK